VINVIDVNFPNPVETRADLFGRQKQLEAIQQVLQSPARRTIIVFGERVMGKTSLLNVAVEWALHDQDFAVIQLPRVGTRQELEEELLEGLAGEYGTSLDQTGLRDPEGHLLLSGVDDLFRHIGTSATAPVRSRFLVCLDELDSVLMTSSTDAEAGQILEYVSDVAQGGDLPIRFMVTMTRIAPRVSPSAASRFKATAEIVELTPWTADETREFTDWLVGDRFQFSDANYQELFLAGGGHPYFTKAILQTLLDSHDQMSQILIDADALRSAIDASAESPEVDFTTSNLVVAHFSTVELDAVKIIAFNSNLVGTNEIRRRGPAYKKAAEELCDRGYLRLNEDGYNLTIGLMSKWLRKTSSEQVHRIIEEAEILGADPYE
jgi:hypothetical protein